MALGCLDPNFLNETDTHGDDNPSPLRPDHRRVRRPHRGNAGQHGPAAPEHPRRAAARPAHRRRDRLGSRAAPRLPAPLCREDRRERDADPVHPLHRPDGLPRRHEHEPRLLPRRREAVRHDREDTRKGQRHPRHHLRAEPHRQPPCRDGDVRPRPRHVQPVPLRLPRTRDDPRPVRGGLRRPPHVQLHHRRRRPRRSARRLGRSTARSSSITSSRGSRSITRC